PEHEEHCVPFAQAKLGADRLGPLRPDVLGDWPRTLEDVAFLAPEHVGKARLALTLGPGIHPVAKGAAAAGLGRNGPDLRLVVAGELAGEDLEARPRKVRADRLHLDRVAQ